jgi:hypothetical protein
VSYVGFQGGAQPVYFVGTCMARNLCHELLHTLGLRHEHTRLDPDHYVTIQWGSQVRRTSIHLMGIACASGAGQFGPWSVAVCGLLRSETIEICLL